MPIEKTAHKIAPVLPDFPTTLLGCLAGTPCSPFHLLLRNADPIGNKINKVCYPPLHLKKYVYIGIASLTTDQTIHPARIQQLPSQLVRTAYQKLDL